MANLASVLKEEISRIARKELRTDTESLKKTSARYRSDIAALKRRVDTLERQLAQVLRQLTKADASRPTVEPSDKVRFSPKGFAAHRARLELSAADMGRLLGVSGATIYNWETGKTKPRAEQLPAIAAIRRMSKREALALLQSAE